MPLFGKSSKSPSDVVRNLKDALITLEKGGQDAKKQEKVNLLESVLYCFEENYKSISLCYFLYSNIMQVNNVLYRHKKTFQNNC